MVKVLMNNPANGKVAIFEEAPGGGDIQSPTSLRHRPLNDPMNWLANIYFHSDFNYYGVIAKNMAKVINHPAIPGRRAQESVSGIYISGQGIETHHTLLVHGLGYVPLFFVAYNGQMIPHGTPIQIESGGRCRIVSAYATTTEIRLREIGFSTLDTLSAIALNYQVLAFRRTAADPALPLLEIGPADIIFGRGKFRLAQNHLRQVGAGASPFALQQGISAAIRGGGLRVITPDGGVITVNNFNGLLSAPPVINVGI